MACNCKKKMVLEDEYGVKENENIVSKKAQNLIFFTQNGDRTSKSEHVRRLLSNP